MRKRFPVILCIGLLVCEFFSNVYLSYAMERGKLEETGHVIWNIKTNKKLIALTFDDGPHPVYTSQILDLLAAYKAKATFFVVGSRVKKYPELAKREIEEGHEIANHTYNHLYRQRMDEKTLKEELERTDEMIYETTGVYPVFYRPVGGYYNDLIIKTAVDKKLRVIMWSWHQDSRDWSRPGVKKIITNVLDDYRPGDIVLFHDSGGNRSQTIAALKVIIPTMQRAGYEFVTISELLRRTGIDPDPVF